MWLAKEGANRLHKVTAEHVGDSLAVLINSVVVAVSYIQEGLSANLEIPQDLSLSLGAEQAKQPAKAVSQTWPTPAAR